MRNNRYTIDRNGYIHLRPMPTAHDLGMNSHDFAIANQRMREAMAMGEFCLRTLTRIKTVLRSVPQVVAGLFVHR